MMVECPHCGNEEFTYCDLEEGEIWAQCWKCELYFRLDDKEEGSKKTVAGEEDRAPWWARVRYFLWGYK